jgi:alkylation response protein AidB-like acyl-CoA dehydrogenase
MVMNSFLKRSLFVAGAVLALGQGAVRAADFRDMTVNVPFPFLIKDKLMPAGKYELQRDDQDRALMLVRGDGGRRVGSFVLTEPASGRDPSGNKPCLSFTRDGNRYKLSSVWESNDDGISVIVKK